MKSAKKTLGILFVLAISLMMQSCGAGRPDAEIQSEIESQIQTNQDLSSINATVIDADVTLTGQCKDENTRAEAEKTAKKVAGVGKVTNNIMVSPNIVATPDAELKENTKRIASKYDDIQAVVNNGIITLRGEIKKSKVTPLMMELSALRPLRIENQLLVK